MTQPIALPDPTLELAEQQLALLGELTDMAMAVARAFSASAIASAKAEEMILGEEYFTPEVGRAKACGARDAAESFQKVSRAVRLTLMLRMNLAEIVRDIRAGQVTYLGGIAVRKDAGETPADQGALRVRRRPASSSSEYDAAADRRRSDTGAERLIDIERGDILLHAPFEVAVDQICDDLGATVDWAAWRVNPEGPAAEPVRSPAPPLSPSAAPDPDIEPPERSPPVPARPSG